ncbi:MAG TPA: ABC transporter permease [Ornithinimicrobium sp.]|uniref:ABC transporter permease n=1 Tax=Ornithinimicrobium sp. TaxID=1977084 RepID=UPI002B485DDC|nr:ABC transporter permease [Ornithinimicrobium sp.]HKJ12452.1 ABC transporter permease [Ornithinimicrobium sp.]
MTRVTPSPERSAERARRLGWWYAAESQLRSMRAYLGAITLSAALEPLLYLLAMGVGLGTLVDAQNGPVDGVDYLVFVAPALLVASVVMSVGTEMTYPVMDGFKWHRLYYAPAATAVTPQQVATGHFVAAMIRFTVQALVFYLVMLAFGAVTLGASILVVPAAVLAAAAAGAPLQAFAATRQDEGGAFVFVQRFVVMPMFLFSGTFFPLASMPLWLQWVGWVSPVWHGSQLARLAAYGAPVPGWLVAVHVLVLAALAVTGIHASRRVYARRLAA